MTSATAHPVDDPAHRDVPGAPTHPEAARAAEEIATNTVVPTVARGRQTTVQARQVREATNRTVQVVELRRVQ